MPESTLEEKVAELEKKIEGTKRNNLRVALIGLFGTIVVAIIANTVNLNIQRTINSTALDTQKAINETTLTSQELIAQNELEQISTSEDKRLQREIILRAMIAENLEQSKANLQFIANAGLIPEFEKSLSAELARLESEESDGPLFSSEIWTDDVFSNFPSYSPSFFDSVAKVLTGEMSLTNDFVIEVTVTDELDQPLSGVAVTPIYIQPDGQRIDFYGVSSPSQTTGNDGIFFFRPFFQGDYVLKLLKEDVIKEVEVTLCTTCAKTYTVTFP